MIRFSTVAANADVLGDNTPLASEPETVPRKSRAAAAQRRSPERPEHRRGRAPGKDSGNGRPGKDINAAGFVKDPDATKPS
jgi:hypothetical protein